MATDAHTEADMEARSDTIDLEESRRCLIEAAAALPAEAYDEPNVVGEWSIRECLAHLAAWDSWVLEALNRYDRGEPIGEFPREHEMNGSAPHRWADRAMAELFEALTGATGELARRLQTQTDDERAQPCYDIGDDCLSVNDVVDALIEHDVMHTADIRAWRKTAGV